MQVKVIMDLCQFIQSLGSEKYRALIIHTAPEKSQLLSEFAKALSIKMDGEYLDLLGEFTENQDLASMVDLFTPEKFKAFLVEKSKDHNLLVVDRSDLLLDTWRKEDRQSFFRMIKRQWNSFLENYQATLIFCLQTSREIQNLDITDTHSDSRILKFSDLDDVE